MRQRKIAVLVLALLCGLVVPGCGQKIKLYEQRDSSWQPTTLHVWNNLTELYIDGKLMEWDRSYNAGGVEIKLAPGSYELQWSLEPPERSWSYKGGGTLVVKKYSRYFYIKYAYRREGQGLFRKGTDHFRKASYSDVKVESHFTWIEDGSGHDIVVGIKPLWAY